MKKIILLLATTIAFAAVSCQNTREVVSDLEATEQGSEDNNPQVYEGLLLPRSGQAVPGSVIIKVSQETYDSIEKGAFAEDMQLRSAPAPMLRALNSIQASKIERVFSYAGKYEERSVKDGMHLWLKVTFDEQVPVSEAMQSLYSVSGVEVVEFEGKIKPMSVEPTSTVNLQRQDSWRFNDPYLPYQFHYNNLGSSKVNGGVMGADINLMKAWEVETGKANVIVCVVDGCIEVRHQDLKDNIWNNKLEMEGTPGVDDDKNGKIDDFHGWNFVNNSNQYVMDKVFHGTHVAGTVSARNNNNIGVAGVAGGDGTQGSGVKLITSGIFSTVGRGGNSADAIKYGADNGAVISQNSWGYTTPGPTPQVIKAAIDYFIEHAGCDEHGNQRPDSPMKGGIVIFAAGNDDSEERYGPGEYEPVFTVASMDPGFQKASYSNYGDWVDITAPGGDQDRYGSKAGVLSTYAMDQAYAFDQEKGYARYQGTSMACPHVSGVAALVVSKRGGQGFTAKDLERYLRASTHDMDKYNPDYVGKLGDGYIDAYLALTLENKNINPEAPKFMPEKSPKDKFLSTTVYWSVPKDGDDGAPARYHLYVSDKPLNKSNYTSAQRLGNIMGYVSNNDLEAGKELSYQISGLTDGTTYYFAIVAIDRWGLMSEPSFMETKTKTNNLPVITNVPKEPIVLLDINGSTDYLLEVNEPDAQTWKFSTSGNTSGVTFTKTDKGVNVRIRPVLSEGDYKFGIEIVDQLGGKSTYEIPFRIVSVEAPEISSTLPNVLIGVENEPLTADLSKNVKPQGMLKHTYKAASSNGTVASVTVDGSKVTVKGHQPGKATINVVVSNGFYETRTSFDVSVTKNKDNDVYAVWPLPLKDKLNFWVKPNSGKPVVTISTLTGEKVIERALLVDHEGMASVAVKSLAPGSYRLRVTAGGKEALNQVVQKR